VSAEAEAPAQTQSPWTPLTRVGDLRVGEFAPPRRLELSDERIERLRAALRVVVADVDPPLSIADICPDPLVFAVESGLHRPMEFERSIDGGSTWCDCAPVGTGALYAVSRISEAGERITHDGRRLVRVVYETRFTNSQGLPVGTVTGTSIHTGSAQ
jgi:hypothetical protein